MFIFGALSLKHNTAMKYLQLLVMGCCLLISESTVAQLNLKRKAEKKADQVLDNLLFGKKKKKGTDTNEGTQTPSSSYPSGSSESNGDSDDDYIPKSVNWDGIDAGQTIHFTTLIDLLPEATQGFKRGEKPEGAMYSTQGFKYSTGMKEYRMNDRELTITLSDYLGSEGLINAQTQQYEYESTDGFMKSIESDGMAGWLAMEYKSAEGTIILTKGNRFLLSINTGGTNEEELRAILSDVDLSSLPLE